MMFATWGSRHADQGRERVEEDAAEQGAPRHGGWPFEEIDVYGQQGRGEQDLDDRLVELVEELLPERLARQRRQAVAAELHAALDDLFCRQAGLGRVGELFLDVAERSHGLLGARKRAGASALTIICR